MINKKHLCFALALLSGTCLAGPALAVPCPGHVAGTITVNTNNINATCNLTNGQSIVVTNTGAINVAALYGVSVLTGVTASSISNSGVINNTALYGIGIIDGNIGSITNAPGGSINGNITGLLLDGATVTGNITNHGLISGTTLGLSVTDGSVINGTIENHGTIDKLYVSGAGGRVTVNNYGTLDNVVWILDTTLNLEAGSVSSADFQGTNAIVNVNTNFSTTGNYGGTLNLQEMNIANGVTFGALGNNTFLIDDITNNGTFSILEGRTVAITGNYTQTATGMLSIQANTIANYGAMTVSVMADFAPASNIFVDVSAGASFNNNDALTSVITAGTLQATTFNVTDNSALFDFNAVLNLNTVDLRAVVSGSTSVEQSVNNQGNTAAAGAARVLDGIIASAPGGDMGDVVNALGILNTESEISSAASQTLPVLTGATTSAILQSMNTNNRVVQARQQQNTGLSSGDGFITERQFWLKPFGTWSAQDTQHNIAGYDGKATGMIAGVDGVAGDDWRVGFMASYANIDIDGGNDLSDLSVDSYQAGIYSSYEIDRRTEANFQADIGLNQTESLRVINFGGLDRVAKGDYNSYSLHLGGGVGRVYNVGQETTLNLGARIDYNVITNAGYTESDAGALNLRVKSQTTDQLVPTVSARLSHRINGSFDISLDAGIGYDILNDRNSVKASFVGGGGAFVTNGIESSPWLARTGIGLAYQHDDSMKLNLRYDREDRGRDFDSQTASIKLEIPF